jgi:hypothetical protein
MHLIHFCGDSAGPQNCPLPAVLGLGGRGSRRTGLLGDKVIGLQIVIESDLICSNWFTSQ